MNLVGELVLARNQVLQFTTQRADSAFLATSQRLNLITTELQGSIMKTRMQPIGNVWGRLPRVVRDLATACGKQVRIEMEGKETELDKTIIEAIKDPLTHIVRNSVDHGIETPDVRVARGKPEEGCLKMRAYHEGGQVNIEITDDGGGIDCERVKQKALQGGLITREQASRISDHEALHLIFLPGFSTAEKVTNVSGRGVGMDVVRQNVEALRGTLAVQSRDGLGTMVSIRVPLTIAIIDGFVVGVGDERYVIPGDAVCECITMPPSASIGDRDGVVNVRGVALPYARLGSLFGTVSVPSARENLVVVQHDGRQFGLVVDSLIGERQAVLKPLHRLFDRVPGVSGSTILGDGRVSLILDVPHLLTVLETSLAAVQ
jgi:two-component system chemotaxis sensor kinase CheA